jgi:hypothetical protein
MSTDKTIAIFQKKQTSHPVWYHRAGMGSVPIRNERITEIATLWKDSLKEEKSTYFYNYSSVQLRSGRMSLKDFTALFEQTSGFVWSSKDRNGKHVVDNEQTRKDNLMGLFLLPYPHPVVFSVKEYLEAYEKNYVFAVDDLCDWVKYKVENSWWDPENPEARPVKQIPYINRYGMGNYPENQDDNHAYLPKFERLKQIIAAKKLVRPVLQEPEPEDMLDVNQLRKLIDNDVQDKIREKHLFDRKVNLDKFVNVNVMQEVD